LSETNKSVPVPAIEASPDGCRAIAEILSRIGDKWTVLVVANLASGSPLRYNQLRRQVEGISQRMLTLTLKGLEQDGIINRKLYPTIPPRVEYELTPLGHKLVVPLRALYEWALEHRPEILLARMKFWAEPPGYEPRESSVSARAGTYEKAPSKPLARPEMAGK
jgi:DNA-binding HxlR family transcriptional regulator